MHPVQAFVMNGEQFTDWQTSTAVARYAAEVSELLPAFASAERWARTTVPRPQVCPADPAGRVSEGAEVIKPI